MNYKWIDQLLEEISQDDFGRLSLEQSNILKPMLDLKKRK